MGILFAAFTFAPAEVNTTKVYVVNRTIRRHLSWTQACSSLCSATQP